MLTLRLARPDEAELVAQIHEAAARAAYGHIFPADQPFPAQEAKLRWQTFRGRIILAEVADASQGGEPTRLAVGFAAADDAELHALYVLPQYWGRGVGHRLLEAAGPVRTLWVLRDNLRARRFYEQHGWVPDGAEQAPDGPIELRYRLPLGSSRA